MGAFKSVRGAKDYVAGLIAEQAEREGAPLTEIERKMLYFTEEGGLSAEMAAVNEEFDRDYDQDVYEARIGGLVSRLIARDENGELEGKWDKAVTMLSRGDHYLLILLGAAPEAEKELPARLGRFKPWLPSSLSSNDPKDALRMIVCAFAILVIALILVVIKAWLFA